MKTLFNVLSIIVKVITILFAVIGAIMSIFMLIMGKVYINNVYDVVDAFVEFGDFDPDNECQNLAITRQALDMTMGDPRIRNNKFIKAVSRSVNRIVSFVANP